SESSGLLRSSALMAAGSIVSRATGFVRSAVIAAALGVGLLGDGYAVANNVPNILYMLLIGGTLNAVFVPELVRAAKEHADGSAGDARLLGWGTTAGIAVQALALIPSLRSAGFRWRPRFDWRGSGLGRPLRSAGWAVLLVVSNQLAYWVVTRLATTAGAEAVAE